MCEGVSGLPLRPLWGTGTACLWRRLDQGKRDLWTGDGESTTYGKVLEGAKLAKESKADLILRVGGGSVMNCCKAVSMAAVYDGDIWEDFWARQNRAGFIQKQPFLIWMGSFVLRINREIYPV